MPISIILAADTFEFFVALGDFLESNTIVLLIQSEKNQFSSSFHQNLIAFSKNKAVVHYVNIEKQVESIKASIMQNMHIGTKPDFSGVKKQVELSIIKMYLESYGAKLVDYQSADSYCATSLNQNTHIECGESIVASKTWMLSRSDIYKHAMNYFEDKNLLKQYLSSDQKEYQMLMEATVQEVGWAINERQKLSGMKLMKVLNTKYSDEQKRLLSLVSDLPI
jgi:hypothetical protein